MPSKAVEALRKAFFEGDEIRDRGLQTPEEVKRFDDIVYGSVDKKYQSLDVYRPKDRKGKLPVIVSVHGGGLVYADKERYQYYCMELARNGFAVVNFSYRLAPEYQFPAPFEDTNLVFNWVFDHQEEYGFDTSRLFAVGDSAGAFILSIYAGLCTNHEYAEKFDFSLPEGIKFTAIGLFCGNYQTDLSTEGLVIPLEVPVSNRDLMLAFLPEKGSEKEIEVLNPAPFVTKDYPPAYIMTSNGDFLKDQAIIMVNAFLENNVTFEFQFFGGKKFLGHVFHLNIRDEEAKKANASLIYYFNSFLN